MAKVARIVAMLAVYLVWICGNSAVALTCHAHQDKHIHCCKSCECHHEGCDKLHVEAPHACHHDHSNKIALYDTAKKSRLNIEPIVLSITAQIENNINIEEIPLLSLQHHERKVPIPSAPTLSRRGMRAPPVIA